MAHQLSWGYSSRIQGLRVLTKSLFSFYNLKLFNPSDFFERRLLWKLKKPDIGKPLKRNSVVWMTNGSRPCKQPGETQRSPRSKKRKGSRGRRKRKWQGTIIFTSSIATNCFHRTLLQCCVSFHFFYICDF